MITTRNCKMCFTTKPVSDFSKNYNVCKPFRCAEEKHKRDTGMRPPHNPVSPEYTAWQNAKKRCYNENTSNYAEYGGMGIRMSAEWVNSPQTFINDMGPRPDDKEPSGRSSWSLDRIDVNGDYAKENCRWATFKEQNRNRRDTVYINIGDRVEKLIEVSETVGISRYSMLDRISAGKTGDDLITPKPVRTTYIYNDEEYHLCDLSKISGIDKSTLRYRLVTCQMSVSEAITKPIRRKEHSSD